MKPLTPALSAPLLIWLVLEPQMVYAQRPAIRLSDTKATVDVIGLDPADVEKLAKSSLAANQWREIFATYVQKAGNEQMADKPAVLGSYALENGIIRFKPRFPLVPGVHYRAVFHLNKIPGHRQAGQDAIVSDILIPKPDREPTIVKHVYPSGDRLAENHLRFYIHFSAPMRQGQVYQHIHLLDARGKPVRDPFLELDEELWDPQGKRFTLFFHPGRIKKGLKPREELGPILEQGKTYTLVIDQAWKDADGVPLKDGFRKTFAVEPALEKSPDPNGWKIEAPSAGKSERLRLRFPGPLDHALLERLIWITDSEDQKVPGTVAVRHHETCWEFLPARPWQSGSYHVVVDTRLEDPAGNSLRRPFEVDVFHPIERRIEVDTVRLPFRVGSASAR